MNRDSNEWKILRTVIEIALIAIAVYLVVSIYLSLGMSEANAEDDDGLTEAYILCVDYVNVRPFPNRKGDELGRFECGTRVWLDGRKRNGFLHVVNTGLEDAGWIYAGFIVYDEPEKMCRSAVIVSKGRLAARKYVNGKRTRWLKPLAHLIVYAWSDEWCVTNCGYVKSQYLELEGE